MENTKRIPYNRKDTVKDKILQNDQNDNNKLSSTRNIFKKQSSNLLKSQRTLGSNFDSPSISKVSGFETLIMKKKNYFKRIKQNNMKKQEEILHKQRLEIISKFILYVFSNVINIFTIFNYILQTYYDKNNDNNSKEISKVLMVIEVSSSFYFLFEFIIIFMRVKNIWSHLFSFDSFIDLVTTAPSIISYFWLIDTNLSLNLSFIRIFRIFRVFRILRIYKSLRMIQNELNAETEIAEGEIKETHNPIKLQAFTIIVVLLCNFFICSGLVLGLQDLIEGAFSKKDMTFADALYFIIITCSSTGYGDIRPTHPVSRIFIICVIFSLIVIVSNQVSKLVTLLNIWGPGLLNYSGAGHIIIICDASIDLTIFLIELKKRNNSEVIVISKEIKVLPSRDYPFYKTYLINVNSIDLEVLERANTKEAECLFIFSTKSVHLCDQKEKVIDFLILKINRYYPNVSIYVQTLYSEQTFNDFNSNSYKNKLSSNLNLSSKGSNINSNDSVHLNKNKMVLKYKKIIPIMRLKSLMISKSVFLNGFSTFSQNLLFNDTIQPKDLDPYDPIMQSYFLGCENKLLVRPFPKYFYNKEFNDSVLLIYSKSIFEYFSKLVSIDDRDENRPVLLIGIIENSKFFQNRKQAIKIMPGKFVIKPWTLGIFISYDNNDYLNKFLNKFQIEENNLEILENSENMTKEFDLRSRRRTAFAERISENITIEKDVSSSGNDSIDNKQKDISLNFRKLNLSPVKIKEINCNRKLSRFKVDHIEKYENELVDIKLSNSNSEIKEKYHNNNLNRESNILTDLNNIVTTRQLLDETFNDSNHGIRNSFRQMTESHKDDIEITNIKEEVNYNIMIEEELNNDNKCNNFIKFSENIKNKKNKRNSKFLNSKPEVKLLKISQSTKASKTPKIVKKNSNKSQSNASNSNNIMFHKKEELELELEIPPESELIEQEVVSPLNNNTIKNTPMIQVLEKFKTKKNKKNLESSFGKISKSSSVLNSIREEEETFRREAFNKRKNLLLRSQDVFIDRNTRNNILFLQTLEDKNVEDLQEAIEKETNLRYSKISLDQEVQDHEYFVENRVYDVEKNNISDLFSNHIIIIGYQDNLAKLIKLINYHDSERDICIMTQHEFDDKIMHKLLKQFKSLIYLKGEPQNPFHLINAGVQKAHQVIFLVENIFKKTNEDMNKILSFKSIDYFFNQNMLLELWDKKSTRLIGYQPIDSDTKVIHNEFLNPQFMAGRIIYMSHFERILAMAHSNENVIEAWMELLGIGFKFKNLNGVKTLGGNKNRDGFPAMVSIEVPEGYLGKEYYVLMSDLLSLESPVVTLGIYIENPLTYMQDKNQGKINKFTRTPTPNLKIVTSYKKTLINSDNVENVEMGYMDDLKVLREISYNDKVVLDYVDIRRPHLPIFITNPPPGFIIGLDCKIMVLYQHSTKNFGLKDFQTNLTYKAKQRMNHTFDDTSINLKSKLNFSQDNFYFYVNTLKEKIAKEYTNAFKVVEKNKLIL